MKPGILTSQMMEDGVPCPIGRSADPSRKFCVARGCVLFREMPMTCTPAWVDAVKRVATEIGDKTPGKTEAARKVAADPEAHGLERLFYCGLGGRPE